MAKVTPAPQRQEQQPPLTHLSMVPVFHNLNLEQRKILSEQNLYMRKMHKVNPKVFETVYIRTNVCSRTKKTVDMWLDSFCYHFEENRTPELEYICVLLKQNGETKYEKGFLQDSTRNPFLDFVQSFLNHYINRQGTVIKVLNIIHHYSRNMDFAYQLFDLLKPEMIIIQKLQLYIVESVVDLRLVNFLNSMRVGLIHVQMYSKMENSDVFLNLRTENQQICEGTHAPNTNLIIAHLQRLCSSNYNNGSYYHLALSDFRVSSELMELIGNILTEVKHAERAIYSKFYSKKNLSVPLKLIVPVKPSVVLEIYIDERHFIAVLAESSSNHYSG